MMASLRQLGDLIPQGDQTNPPKSSSPLELSFRLFMHRVNIQLPEDGDEGE